MPSDAEQDRLAGSMIGKYRLIRKLGEGGMGSVYLAERTEDFEQRVALKLILEGLHLESTVARFRVEQQALAALQHPNIVQMVDAGVSADGIPYLAMDYVDGEPLDQYCDRLRLPIEKRIALFLQVLDAVDFAHRHFLIHCDLKFSNILVTADGQAKLLDFGVTKLLQPEVYGLDEGATQATLRPFTPEFASPEQLRMGALTTATDVYSAGVVLYALLCGSHPFDSLRQEPVKLLRAICDTDADPMNRRIAEVERTHPERARVLAGNRSTQPHELGESLSGDLDAIVDKALRKEPEARYAGAASLAEDLRSCLTNRPVMARAPSFRYRAAKFLRRHRALAASVALVALTLGIGLFAWLSQSVRAQQSRARATARFGDVRQLTNTLLFDFYDAVAKLPGATPAQENLVRWSLTYLDDLSRRDTSDLTLRLELAESYRKLGNLLGNPYENNLGKPEEAIATLTKGILLMEPDGLANTPATLGRDGMITMARLYGARSEVRWMANQSELCLKDGAESVRLYDQLADLYPADAEVQMETAAKHEAFADLYAGAYQIQFDLDAARKHLDLAAEYARRAIAADPKPVRPYRALGIYRMKIADVIAYTDPERAIGVYKEAAEHFDRIPAEGQQELATKRTRRALVFRSAWSYSALGRYKEAIAMYESVAADHRESVRLDPTNEKVHWDYSVLLRQLGEARLYVGDDAGALANYTQCIELMEEFFKNGLQGERRAAFGEAMVYQGITLAHLGRESQAADVTRRGLAIIEAELKEPDVGESLLQRAAEAFIIALPSRLRRPREALRLLDRRTDSSREQDAFYRLLRAEALAAMGRTDEAIAEAKRTMAITSPRENVNYWKRLLAVAGLRGAL